MHSMAAPSAVTQSASGDSDGIVIDSMLPLRSLIQLPYDDTQVMRPLSGALATNNLMTGLPVTQRADRKKARQKQQNSRRSTRQAKAAAPSPNKSSSKGHKVQGKSNTSKQDFTLPKRSLCDLPLTTLSRVLQYLTTECLATMLSVNRYFNHYLKDPIHSGHVWRHARENFLPRPLPPPPTDISENDYGRWLFGWLSCEICEKPTNRVPISISLRAKLCLNVSMTSRCLAP